MFAGIFSVANNPNPSIGDFLIVIESGRACTL